MGVTGRADGPPPAAADSALLHDVRIGRDTIAYETGRQFDGIVANAQVGTSDLVGHTKLFLKGADDNVAAESFDFDGRRLLWRQLGCARWHLEIRNVSSGRVAAEPLRC